MTDPTRNRDAPLENRPASRRQVTLVDVAHASGVSRTTVSNAFNRPDQLSAELRERVLSIATDMGYSGPNPMARMLRTGRAGAIGMVFPGPLSHAFTDPASMAFLTGVAEGCDRYEMGLLILPAETDSAAGSVGQAAVDGFIVHCMAAGAGTLNAVLDRNLPTLAVDLPNAELPPRVSSVGIDDRGGAVSAARHLLALGHKAIGIVSMELADDGLTGPVTVSRQRSATYGVSSARLDGYLSTIAREGGGAVVTGIEETDVTQPDDTRAGIRRLLTDQNRPTAILAMSDVLALMTMDIARSVGLSIPADLSVVGFDDIPGAAQASPPLTTMHQPLREKGYIAVEQLLRDSDEPARTQLAVELRTRGTTAAVGGDFTVAK